MGENMKENRTSTIAKTRQEKINSYQKFLKLAKERLEKSRNEITKNLNSINK